MTVKNRVQLITYPDSLGGDLGSLDCLLQTHLKGLFEGGIHILPPFPSSGDRGFAPLNHLQIATQFGTWEDIRRIGETHAIALDLIVNHISARSAHFQDFLEKGRKSEYAGLFIPLDRIWPGGIPPQEDIEKIFLRRTQPFSDFTIKNTGAVERVWTTFGKTTPSEQIDIDVHSEPARRLLAECLSTFSRNKVKVVRLDAVGYVVKKPGTSCFFVEPEIYEFLDWISGLAHSLGIEVLPEVHAEYATQFKLASRGYWIYDFILPYTVLEALFNGTAERLHAYLQARPPRQFTLLDCHDGVPLKPDLNGLYGCDDARMVVDTCVSRGGNLSTVFSPKHRDPDGFDVHQIRGAFYSLLDCDDDAYLAARAIQFFTPGVPQVYYVGLLAGQNDQPAAQRTNDGREVNRHNYTMDEVARELQRPVVQRLIRLIRFRNEHKAFDGTFRVGPSDNSFLELSWENQKSTCRLVVDFKCCKAVIHYTDEAGNLVDYWP